MQEGAHCKLKEAVVQYYRAEGIQYRSGQLTIAINLLMARKKSFCHHQPAEIGMIHIEIILFIWIFVNGAIFERLAQAVLRIIWLYFGMAEITFAKSFNNRSGIHIIQIAETGNRKLIHIPVGYIGRETVIVVTTFIEFADIRLHLLVCDLERIADVVKKRC